MLGAVAVGGAAYAAGNSSARRGANEDAQNQHIMDLEAQVAAQQAQAAPPPPPPAAAPAPAQSAPDMDAKIAQLQQLASLKTAGVLTDAEFEAQKAKILGT